MPTTSSQPPLRRDIRGPSIGLSHRSGSCAGVCRGFWSAFGVASSITAALTRLTQNQEYGYAAREGVLAEAFVRRIERRLLKGRFGRRIPSRLLGSPGVTGVAIGADVPGVTMRVPEVLEGALQRSYGGVNRSELRILNLHGGPCLAEDG